MSVPLDRLYDFLQNICNHDVIMYRWHPHGSKKLEDFWHHSSEPLSWIEEHITPAVVCHDQEPLHFDYYTTEYLSEFWKDKQFYPVNSKPFMYRVNAHLRGFFLFNGYDLSVLCHSELRSVELEKYQRLGFVGVYYWSHALLARDWFRYSEHDPALQHSLPGPLFLIYNRAWQGTREYRLKFAELLANADLLNHCATSFNAIDDQCHYTQHEFQNSKFQITRQDLEHCYLANQFDSASSADYSTQDYQRTQIEVVLETLFDDSRLHLTEKTLRPIACGQPFILAATHGSLDYLRSYGFETFAPWIDESYDCIEDPAQRLQAIVAEMQRIAVMPDCQRSELIQQVKAIAARNKAQFFSAQWFDRVVTEFRTNFEQAMQQVKAGPRGSYYKHLPSISQGLDGGQYYNRAWPGRRTEQEMQQYLSWVESTAKH